MSGLKQTPVRVDQTRLRILVVEDEADLSDLLSYILRRAGHDLTIVRPRPGQPTGEPGQIATPKTGRGVSKRTESLT